SIAFAVSITFNLLFTYKTCFAERKYEIRNMLISLRPILHDKVIGMGYSFTYELYTGCKPALHLYPTNYKMNGPGALDSLLLAKKIDYVIERNSVESPKSVDSNLIFMKKFPIRCYNLVLFKNKSNP
ncbi:MAG TPA: hypothetical protein VN922_18970, partial [Bacteroidia bacterium]|nr:hypothetical protein [Bacteroidia bacterium]